MIIDERMVTYINSLDTGHTPFLENLERTAKQTKVPIIRREMQSFLKVFLKMKQPKRILEVGTAVGFSAVFMAQYGEPDAEITTIENYEKRIPIARENFEKSGFADRITLISGDAAEVLKTLDGPYDFIFMDAAKGQYIHFLPEVLRVLDKNGVLITDNVLQDGDIIESRFAVERRNRTIHKRMREYLFELTHNEGLLTSVVPLGDGIAITMKSHEKRGNNMRKPELLVPASSLEVLKVAVIFGADAVYIGGEVFGLRAKAKNFSMEDMKEGVEFAHAHGVKVYVTANILAHNQDLEGVRAYFAELKEIGPDALIISDPGVYRIAMEVCPEIERHISTQANNTNYGTYQFWYEQGAKRVVTARELSLAEIKEIREHIPEEMEIETFIHGAMCISYSGRCLLSNYFTGRDANQGACTHPCRWKYAVVEESRPGEYLPVYENERGTYIFNSKDLCMIEHIPDLLDAGIDSYKIEGRMKTALYVATVARTYRKAIDDYLESPKKYEENMEWYRDQISNCTYRQFTTGFFYGKPDHESQIYDSNTYVKEYTYLGIVGEKNEKSRYAIEQRNKFSVGEEIEVMKPDGENVCVTVKGIWDDEGNQMESAPHPKQKLWIDLGVELDRFDILRRKEME